jgi:ABC-type multidrug transport system fused ATPase/permease subunit
MIDQPISTLLFRLWQHLGKIRRFQFCLLLVLMILSTFAEILSIGAVVPFLAVLTTPTKAFYHPNAQLIIQFTGVDTPEKFILLVTTAFIIGTLIAGSVKLILSWASIRLSYATGADLSISVYRKTLYQPYPVHVARNSSEVINGVVIKVNGVISGIIGPTLFLISSLLLLITFFIVFLSAEPFISVLAFGGFGAIYLIIILLTRSQTIKNSKRIAQESTQVIKSLQEGLGGIRDVLIDGSQSVYCQIYQAADHPLRLAQGRNHFISQAPRFGVEALGMVLIAGLAYHLSQQADGIVTVIPVLGALALGAQRMLPVMQLAYASWISMQGGQASLRETLDLLDQPLPKHAFLPAPLPMEFEKHISLSNLSFRYSNDSAWVLRRLNLNISKGSHIGFIGTTGSGKSTLLDIVMGLLEPTEGSISVDGQAINADNQRAWQANIAHVPQSIFLADSTIEENIAFGQPKNKIDHQLVIKAAKQAQIADIIESWPSKYETFVGERGIRLSGGQRQRIGIARALYKNANVIILDEATSALDNETEFAVMDAIEKLSEDVTLLIIAHRLTTLKNCSQIVELHNGAIRQIGNYQEIIVNVT